MGKMKPSFKSIMINDFLGRDLIQSRNMTKYKASKVTVALFQNPAIHARDPFHYAVLMLFYHKFCYEHVSAFQCISYTFE